MILLLGFAAAGRALQLAVGTEAHRTHPTAHVGHAQHVVTAQAQIAMAEKAAAGVAGRIRFQQRRAEAEPAT